MRSHPLRTTLTIDDDVMQAVRVLARQQGSSLGAVIGALARRALSTPSAPAAVGLQLRNGLPLLPVQPQGAPVDLELVNSLREATTHLAALAIAIGWRLVRFDRDCERFESLEVPRMRSIRGVAAHPAP